MNQQPSICPQCNAILLPNTNFCPNCGLRIAIHPQVVSIGRQLWVYFVSLVLPPLGLVWTFKYMRSESTQLKRIAFISFALTIISIIVTIWLTIGFFQSVQQQVNSYQSLGL